MKKSIKTIVVAVCIILAIILIALLYIYSLQHRKDIKNTDKLVLATAIENECEDIHMDLSEENIDENTKVLSLTIDNQSEYGFSTPANKIEINRLIDGKWYYWGTCGNGYEMALGSYSGEKLELTYNLSADVLTDADYIEQYDKKYYIQDGHGGRWIAYPRIQLFPGSYRIRMKGEFLDDGMRDDETLEYEIVYEFEIK